MVWCTAVEAARPRSCTSHPEDLHVVKDNLFPTPALVWLIQEHSGTAWREMYQVYNMGHRMEVYTTPAHAQVVMDIAARPRGGRPHRGPG